MRLPVASECWPVGSRRTECPRHTLVARWLVFVLALAPASATLSCLALLAEAAIVTDEDGVQMLYPSAPGMHYRLSGQDPNRTPGFAIEKNIIATAHVDAALHYWN